MSTTLDNVAKGDTILIRATVKDIHPGRGLNLAANGNDLFYVGNAAVASVEERSIMIGDLAQHRDSGHTGLVKGIYDGEIWVAWVARRDQITPHPVQPEGKIFRKSR